MPFDLPLDYLLVLALWVAGGFAVLVQLLKLRRRARQDPFSSKMRIAMCGLSLWTLLAGLTLLETYFAFLFDQSDGFTLSKVSQHWYRRHVHENEQGFRDDHSFERAKPDGKCRICFLGDSFTFGHGVKNVADRFSDRIGAGLERTRPGKFVVANLGSPGIHVENVSNLLRMAVNDGYDIDVAVYTICLNDIESFEPRFREMQETLSRVAPRSFLLRESYFLNFLYLRLVQDRHPAARSFDALLAEAYDSSPWEKMRGALTELHSFCRNQEIDLRIAVFPFVHNLGPKYPFEHAHEKIVRFCRQNGIRCLDLKSYLEPHVKEGLSVHSIDHHPNARAHALAADAIEEHLLSDLFNDRDDTQRR